ncbi:hypothetical protein STENM327S_05073 [Streptomyces tendae]
MPGEDLDEHPDTAGDERQPLQRGEGGRGGQPAGAGPASSVAAEVGVGVCSLLTPEG